MLCHLMKSNPFAEQETHRLVLVCCKICKERTNQVILYISSLLGRCRFVLFGLVSSSCDSSLLTKLREKTKRRGWRAQNCRAQTARVAAMMKLQKHWVGIGALAPACRRVISLQELLSKPWYEKERLLLSSSLFVPCMVVVTELFASLVCTSLLSAFTRHSSIIYYFCIYFTTKDLSAVHVAI